MIRKSGWGMSVWIVGCNTVFPRGETWSWWRSTWCWSKSFNKNKNRNKAWAECWASHAIISKSGLRLWGGR